MVTLKDPDTIEKEMLPLTMAEINYLCIDKCTMTTKSEEYINTKTFNQNYKVKSNLSAGCFNLCMEVMEHREKIGDYYGWKHI